MTNRSDQVAMPRSSLGGARGDKLLSEDEKPPTMRNGGWSRGWSRWQQKNNRISRAITQDSQVLELQLEAAAGGRFEGLLGGVVEVVVLQPATGRCKWERARAHATHPWAKEGLAAVHAGCWPGWQRRGCWRGGGHVLRVCAGRVWAVRVQGWSGAHAGNSWSRSRRRRGGVETRPRRGPVTHGRVGSRWQGSRQERREGRVALEDLGERHARRGADVVNLEAAHTAKEGEQGECSERCMPCGRDARASGFDGRAADLSDVRVVLLLRASASAMPPAGPRLLLPRLRKRQGKVNRASATSVHAVRP
eukprot:scaffold43949_cov50-Phaeocystis_antarctica.AAC.3